MLASRWLSSFVPRYALNISAPFERLATAQLPTLPPSSPSFIVSLNRLQCRRHLVVSIADNFAPLAEQVLPALGITPAVVVIYNATGSEYDSDGRVETFRFDRHSIGFQLLPAGGLAALRRLHLHNFQFVLDLIFDVATSNPSSGLSQLSELVLSGCETSVASLMRYCNSAVAATRVVVYGSPKSVEKDYQRLVAPDGPPPRGGRCKTLVVDHVATTDIQAILESPGCCIARLRVLQLALKGPSDWEGMRSPHLVELEVNVSTKCSKVVSLDLNFANFPELACCFVRGCPSITTIAGGAHCSLRSLTLDGCVVHFRGVVKLPLCSVRLQRCVGSSSQIEFWCHTSWQKENCGRAFTCVCGS